MHDLLAHLKGCGFEMLFDLTCIDERQRTSRTLGNGEPKGANGQPKSDFTIVYHLLSLGQNKDVRVKVGLVGEYPSIGTITDLWPCANWYEREAWDMFGVKFEGHPNLRRILLPPWWKGHALRKEHPARATEMGPFQMPPDTQEEMMDELRFDPHRWGLKAGGPDTDYMFLNFGPHHPGTHGVLRIILQLDEEEIVDSVVDIGFHHRGAEKMGERQSWHTYIPYTDRVDYLGGVMNNLPYCLSVEKLAGIEAPDRAVVIRVMMCEIFRLISHLVWLGTYTADVGAFSTVFYMFTDRDRLLDIVEAITGGRMHPGWFRIGGVAADLPDGWEKMVRDILAYLPPKIRQYEKMMMKNLIFKMRTQGIGRLSTRQALDWGITGPNLRATGMEFDFRKKQPYGGYGQFEFDIPTAAKGDCYDRAVVRIEEMRQSLRIIRQCVDNMPAGPYMADHPAATPPMKHRTMQDIETLITHFLNVSWGPVIPAGEAAVTVEGTKGAYAYYLISDGGTGSYRTRIRTPSFPHVQALPEMARGLMVSDLIAILGSIDFVLADVDR
jgi:NADH-quinone oxidoreductase subunit C/D